MQRGRLSRGDEVVRPVLHFLRHLGTLKRLSDA
jgi:hypothetical protein